jgi:membrane protease YdiL (CAAX protease family)
MNLLTSKAAIHPGQTAAQIILFTLGTAILIPIYEEIFFRNLLQGYLQTKLPIL